MKSVPLTGLIALVIGCGKATLPLPDGPTQGGHGTHTDDSAAAADLPHVLILDLDGMHARDLDRFLTDHPDSNMAALAAVGMRYTNASSSAPSDSFPGVLALFTGGSPATTGVYYDLSYDRALSPPGSDCSTRGTTVDFTDAIDADASQPDGGGSLVEALLPRDPDSGCSEVLPHHYLRVNTAFEVVKTAGGRTAWSDKHLSYEILQGMSGAGIDDMYNPEIAAKGVAKSLAAIEAYDDGKVDAVLAEISGKDHTGATDEPVPTLFGMNFQAVSVEQKSDGYASADGTPSAPLADALQHTDESIGRIVAALKDADLWDTTTIVLVAPHGQSPVDPAKVQIIPTTVVPQIVEGVQPGLLAHFTGDDVGLIWLTDPTQTPAVRTALMKKAAIAGIDTVISGPELAAIFPDPASDPRTPDLIVRTMPGVIYSDSPKLGEHGGLSDDDRSVALLVANAGAVGVVEDPVETRQVAATTLELLGLDAQMLQSVKEEGTTPLPGLLPE